LTRSLSHRHLRQFTSKITRNDFRAASSRPSTDLTDFKTLNILSIILISFRKPRSFWGVLTHSLSYRHLRQFNSKITRNDFRAASSIPSTDLTDFKTLNILSILLISFRKPRSFWGVLTHSLSYRHLRQFNSKITRNDFGLPRQDLPLI
jgi:hypothetical protein